jgi:hypothetical protein
MAGKKNTNVENVSRFMKSEESVAGEDSKPEETCLNWGEHILRSEK